MYYKNGLVMEKGGWKAGRKHGTFEKYHRSGQLELKETFEDGERVR
jgi:antitoxin component YwqK of YwqJK toxin-antitoxin module